MLHILFELCHACPQCLQESCAIEYSIGCHHYIPKYPIFRSSMTLSLLLACNASPQQWTKYTYFFPCVAWRTERWYLISSWFLGCASPYLYSYMFMASLWWCGSQDDIISRFVIGLFPAFDTKLSSAKFYKVMLQEAVEKKKENCWSQITGKRCQPAEKSNDYASCWYKSYSHFICSRLFFFIPV